MPEFKMPGEHTPMFQSLDAVTQGYILAAFFTLDERFGSRGFTDLSIEALIAATLACGLFVKQNDCRIEEAQGQPGYTLASVGHDFWLTRNGHGAGFWSRNMGTLGEQLTDAAKSFGETDFLLADNGALYFT